MSRVWFSKVWQIHAVGLGTCLVITGLAYLVGFAPMVRQAAAIEQQKGQLADQRQQASKLAASRGTLHQQLTRARQAVEAGSFRLRPVGQLNGYLAQLTQLATQNDLTLHEIQPGQVVNGPDYRSVPILMSGIGTYRSCAIFLHKLHDVLPDTRLSSLAMTASDSSRNPGARFRLNLIWYATPPQNSGRE